MRIGRDDIKVLSGQSGFDSWNRSKVALRQGRDTNGKACPACLTTKVDAVSEGEPVAATDLHDGEIAVPTRCLECGSTWYGVYAVDGDARRQWLKYCMLETAGRSTEASE